MGSSCCHTGSFAQSQEIVINHEENMPYPLAKESLHTQNIVSDNKPVELVQVIQVEIQQEYSEQAYCPQLQKYKQNVPNLKISNTKGTLMYIQNQSHQSEVSDQDASHAKSGSKLSAFLMDPNSPQDKSQNEQLDIEKKDKTLFNHEIQYAKQDVRQALQQDTPKLQQQDNQTKHSAVSQRISFNSSSNHQGTPSSNIGKSPIRKPSNASINSHTYSLKLGVELFVTLKKGSITKHYTTGQVLGQGAFGKVWKATHKLTGMVRAMKQIKKSELIKEDEQRLFAEMDVLKNLDHPYIVRLFELFQDANSYYLITEYLSGGELFDRIKKMQSFNERKASDYMRQILSAIVYCHEQKIVHRDLKPENILFESQDANANLKVIDFGCSRKFTDKRMTKKLGTPYYIAPEVLNSHYNEKCDVWSCGVILYILLCGYPPFTGRSEAEIFDKVKQGKVKFPPEDWDNISRDAKNLILKMLQVEPSFRYSAIQALGDPWISKHAPANPINKKVLQTLQAFQAQSFFRQALMQYIVSQMSTTKELEDLQRAFQSLDQNNDGFLSKDELVEGYFKILKNKVQAVEEVNKILELVDSNKTGKLDYSEFLTAAMNQEKILSLRKVEQAFKIFDQDGDGFITRQELEQVMGTLDSEVWSLFLSETDQNNDGRISEEEFKKLLLNFDK